MMMHLLYFTATITLTTKPRISSRTDIECPGDIISYVCSVHSNSENVQLKWHILFPRQSPIEILYDHASTTNIADTLKLGVETTLTNFTRDNYIESLLELTIIKGVPINGTEIECSSENLNSVRIEVLVNTSGIVQVKEL